MRETGSVVLALERVQEVVLIISVSHYFFWRLLLEGLANQDVVGVQLIKIRKDSKEIDTKHLILISNCNILPESIEVGHLKGPTLPILADAALHYQPIRLARASKLEISYKGSCPGQIRPGKRKHFAEDKRQRFIQTQVDVLR